MMRLSRQKLHQLRSGQGVWRVLFSLNFNGHLQASLQWYTVLGRRIHHWHRHHETKKPQHLAILMSCRRLEQLREEGKYWDQPRACYAKFLGDLEGHGAFTKRRAAERYIAEVLSGLHPDVEERVRWKEKNFRQLANVIDDFDDYGYFSEPGDVGDESDLGNEGLREPVAAPNLLNESDLGDEGLREPVDGMSWNKIKGRSV